MKSTMGFIVFVVAVLLILFFLSSSKKAPFIPADDPHKVITTNAACLNCHAPGKQAPLKSTHPPKDQCMICHKVKQAG